MDEIRGTHFDIYSDSVAHGDKGRSGDHLAVRKFDSDRIVLLAVADGVGSHRCDWLASRTACQSVSETFEKATDPLEERLRRSILRAHRDIRSATGDASGMLSTLVTVAWPCAEDWFLWAGIGDSRIYRFSGREDLLLTEDDVGRVILRLNNEVVLSSGAPVFSAGLTKALGQGEDLQFEVRKCEFLPGESVALATDGMHGKGTFLSSLREALHREDMGTVVPSLVRQCSSSNQDDAALVVLRRNDIALADPLYLAAVTQMEDFRQQGLWGHIMCRILSGLLAEAAASGNSDRVRFCLEYSRRFSVYFRREALITIFDHALRENKLDRKAVHLLRTSISHSI